MRTLDSLGDLRSRTVVVRCDLNVPMKDAVITDDGRIRASLQTIRRLSDAGAKVVVISHLGRPEGAPDERYSLAPVATRMSELLGRRTLFASDTVGESARALRSQLTDGDVLLLENLRFNPGETSKEASERQAFAALIAEGADAFVSDGFGVVHRRQASVFELAQLLPSAAGELVAAELDVLRKLTETPDRPYTVVLGGSKVSDKLGVIDHLIDRVDSLLIGGGMVFTFLAAQGHGVASSLLESDQIELVRSYLKRAKERGVEIVLPSDIVVAEAFSPEAKHEVVQADAIDRSSFGNAAIGLDIGPESAEHFADIIERSRTVFWNGPMGVFEMPAFASGTRRFAEALTKTTGFTVVGGGDSAAAVRALGFSDNQFGHISTGGGASLEYLEGKTLPGLEVLA